MTEEERRVYDAAVEFIEAHGGIVFDQNENNETILKKIEQNIEEDSKSIEEYEKRKEDAFEEFNKLLGSKNFSYSAVEDLMHGHGIEMDDLEEYIHNYY